MKKKKNRALRFAGAVRRNSGCAALLVQAAFTTILVLGLLASAIGAIYLQNRQEIINFHYALSVAKFAWQMDRFYDSLPDVPLTVINPDGTEDFLWPEWGVMVNNEDLFLVVQGMLPYFPYELGIGPIIPRMVAFQPFATGDEHFHIGGQASCTYRMFIVNYAYINKFSPRFQRDSLLPTIVHELGHVQGICSQGGPGAGRMEGFNQVATWEVLASACRHGNTFACKPLAGELRNAAMDYVRAYAWHTGHDDIYRDFALGMVYNSANERSRITNAWEYWDEEDNQKLLRYVIINYGQQPWIFMTEALSNEAYDYKTRQTPFYPTEDGTIKCDDLRWFKTHLSDVRAMAIAKAAKE